jgi:hypothetical protein
MLWGLVVDVDVGVGGRAGLNSTDPKQIARLNNSHITSDALE